MWDYPSASRILESTSEVVREWEDSQFRNLKAKRIKLADVYSDSESLASRLVETAFPSAPTFVAPIGKPENSTSNGAAGVGIFTAVFLIVLAPVSLGLSLLGIPAVLFWLGMAKATREPPDMPQQRAARELESRIYSWKQSKERATSSVAEALKGRFSYRVARELGVPERLWSPFSDALEASQFLPFTELEARLRHWADEPEFPAPPGQIEQGVSHEEYEAYCCRVMHHWGYMDAETTRYAQDGGVDIFSNDFVVQCKHVAGTVGAPDVQRIFGIAASKGKQALIFSAGSFSKAALKFANDAGVGAVVISEVNGMVRPQNAAAEEIIKRNSAGPR
jgi:hypothetical protein